jgi:heme-degrading monooxygenase HmoA
MFSVIFEVFPKKEWFEEYLALAKHLKPLLDKIDAFVDNERFKSKRRRGWILSHSTWRDEKSVVRWRTTREHHKIQERGRSEIFQDYHLRVGDVIADTNPPREAGCGTAPSIELWRDAEHRPVRAALGCLIGDSR